MARSGKASAQRKGPPPSRRELLVAEVGARGDGVARTIDGDVYVPYALAGERIIASVSGDRGRLDQLLTPSPSRAEPPCPHFGACGGCALQHMNRDAYRDWKRARVVDALLRVGLDAGVVGETVEIKPASRRRATFAVERSGAQVALSFHERASRRLQPFETCLILHPALMTGLAGVKRVSALLPAQWRTFRVAVTLCENGLDIDIAAPSPRAPEGEALTRLAAEMTRSGVVRLSIAGESLLTVTAPVVRFGEVAVTPPPGGFLQASAEGESAIRAFIEAGTARARRILDLFSGCGAFALPLSNRASVRAIDSDRRAIAALDAASRNSGYRPVTSEARDLFERPLRPDELRGYDCAIFDPPRAGAKAQAECLAQSEVAQVIAISCNPATFARDAAILAAGGFLLMQVTPIDQFVYSAHVELAAIFERRRG